MNHEAFDYNATSRHYSAPRSRVGAVIALTFEMLGKVFELVGIFTDACDTQIRQWDFMSSDGVRVSIYA